MLNDNILNELILKICEYYEVSDLDSESFTNTITTLIKIKNYTNKGKE